MNKRYKQIGPKCSGYAIGNGQEQVTGVAPTDEQLVEFYKTFDTDGREGMGLDHILAILEVTGYFGFKVKAFEEVYNVFKGNKKTFRGIREALSQPDKAVIISLRIRDDVLGIQLDENNFMIPGKGKVKSWHAMCVEEWKLGKWRKNLGLKIENTWGPEWGEDGCFNLRLKHFWTEVQSAYVVSFMV